MHITEVRKAKDSDEEKRSAKNKILRMSGEQHEGRKDKETRIRRTRKRVLKN